MRRLPPLIAIEAFVQVARLGSIKAAAEELALSSPALSRRIQQLERFVNRRLFDRQHQAMRLNGDGETLYNRLGPALDILAEAVEISTSGGHELLRLRLGVSPLYASSQNLMKRMANLRAYHPELHIDIDTAPHALSRLGEGLDVAIALAREMDPAFYSYRLGLNKIMLFVSTSSTEGNKILEKPEDLAHQTLFLHREMPDNFTTWREAIGMPKLEPAAIDFFDSGQLMLDAAANGMGIACLLDCHYTDNYRQLLKPLFNTDVDSPYSYWFACRRSSLSRRPVRLFHEWLINPPSPNK
ncbi:MAG: LysR family transcriptional regulator [Zymomonas mobilis subsp. pomaceae]|uniref:Transcriptional regulator, LysR family n=1 Tax=Zymomonas mobilis subsp. pomaceae (strain ATCC 29192 / DSM 22645 / JCM 10191 / CCUG 17912 / NBRC 13757 / NCIMB 11200 / NRRL B-4491 / Barker I) TaxID=579138 RepID=F8EVH2_ZYMMT|nr:LysR family transcriptional regulator [Zymomonas mobilis]AEI37379.1 transcriptional regulator, LysR family [Zymomonas mobilis subsp. pomaceae ATCC 29192]MDX5948746.1 LysR family transcriptional regulator [Zymomonas mobilis subsp. pomaceae]